MKKITKILMIIAFTCSSFIGLSCCSSSISEDSETEQMMLDDAGRSVESDAHCGSI